MSSTVIRTSGCGFVSLRGGARLATLCLPIVRRRVLRGVDDVELAVLSDERARDYEDWVARRLEAWSVEEIQALEHWLLHESHFEFIPAVRAAWAQKAVVSEEPAA
jgi:hypothetical protein